MKLFVYDEVSLEGDERYLMLTNNDFLRAAVLDGYLLYDTSPTACIVPDPLLEGRVVGDIFEVTQAQLEEVDRYKRGFIRVTLPVYPIGGQGTEQVFVHIQTDTPEYGYVGDNSEHGADIMSISYE